MRRLLIPVVLLAACKSPAGAPPSAPAAQAPTHAPADMSHGEAPVGQGTTPAPVSAVAPPRSTTTRHKIRLEMKHARVVLTDGVAFDAWTFGGDVPGPALRVTVGDTIDFTLVNKAPIPHSMDFHAAEVAPSRAYVNVNPNDSLQYRWVARVPGAFMYHCGTAPVALHIASGMYGAIIVDPVRPRPAAREYVLVQSEFYTKSSGSATDTALRTVDWQKLLSLAPDHVVFNGRAAQYALHPLPAKPHELVRLYVVNAGPNRASAFHVVGGIFEKVFQDGRATPTFEGIQTVEVPVGGGAIFEVRLPEPGDYPFVSHAFADATKGAVGILKAE
ncbi:MAG TPA: multicopper oxidase domain-containing protein [Gemmatimonadales bacterium]|nr:multicopper oxidase domain-containing protein [Gemmatimonadales bacterium]